MNNKLSKLPHLHRQAVTLIPWVKKTNKQDFNKTSHKDNTQREWWCATSSQSRSRADSVPLQMPPRSCQLIKGHISSSLSYLSRDYECKMERILQSLLINCYKKLILRRASQTIVSATNLVKYSIHNFQLENQGKLLTKLGAVLSI